MLVKKQHNLNQRDKNTKACTLSVKRRIKKEDEKSKKNKNVEKSFFNFLRDQICRSDLFVTQITNVHAHFHIAISREAGT